MHSSFFFFVLSRLKDQALLYESMLLLNDLHYLSKLNKGSILSTETILDEIKSCNLIEA